MIRLALLTIGFVGATAALLWSVGEPPKTEGVEQVSRARPDTLSLQPALTILSAAPDASLVKTPPEALVSQAAVARSLRPKARPGHLGVLAAVAPRAQAPVLQPAPNGDDDDLMKVLRAMSYGIVEEMKKPAKPHATPAVPAATARAAVVAPPVSTPPAGLSYTVQQGDSLPGIAFRFYGTTVAYLEILQANRGLMEDPSDLRAGMTLRIPDLN